MIGGALFRAREQIIFLRKPRSKNYDNAHHSLPLNSSFPSAAMAGLFQPFVAAFEGLGDRLRDGVGGWEVRFEKPPGAYLHLSKPKWGDEQMDGVHLEAYVSLTEQEGHGEAVVALH